MQKINKLYAAMLIVCLAVPLIFVSFTTLNPISAQAETTIYIDPTPVIATVCETFTVALNVRDVTDLYAWQVKLSWNPNLLECVGYSFGPFLTPPTVRPEPIINNAEGWIIAGDSRMVPSGVSGSGTIFYIEFHCKGAGECDLIFIYSETVLFDSNSIEIPYVAVNGHVIQQREIPEILDVELYPREVVDLEDPTGTQWHELYPGVTNYYHLMGWEPGYVLSPEDQIDMYLIDPPMQIYLESYEPIDLLMPICTMWYEIMPEPWAWHLTSWEDNNGDGYLSACDQIDMTNTQTGDVVWFHVREIIPPDPLPPQLRQMILDVKYWFQVDEVTVDMTLSPPEPPGPQIFVDYKCGYWTFDPKKPICTKWNQIDPELGPVRSLHLTSWEDNGNGVLDPSDIIDMTPLFPNAGPVEYYHVDFISISLKLTPKPSPPVVPPPPFPEGPVYLESALSYYEFDLSNPVCTKWHEIYPVYSRIWHLSSWENFRGLSPSDNIVLALKNEFGEPIPGTEVEYHVDKLTVAMNLTDTREVTHIVKFEESLKEFKMYHWRYPVSTQWHEVNPEYCRQWHILDWLDNGDGYLGYCDLILMIDKHTGLIEEFHVESLSTDMWLTISHDIAVTNVTPLKTVVGQGYTMNINVTVENQGYYMETFTLTVYANETAIATQILTLGGGDCPICGIEWNVPSDFPKGNYTIWAYAVPVLGEIDTADNTFTDGWVFVTIPGDVDANNLVNMLDLYYIALTYGTTPPNPNYNPNHDIDNNGIINMLDLYIAALHYGQTDP
ncbi:MAG: hypothetical protein KIH09_16915 [Candidatus Freyarchaeota archaeon]|nr:hypothetical protein [Candidatus Jordarchaeia archaeon]